MKNDCFYWNVFKNFGSVDAYLAYKDYIGSTTRAFLDTEKDLHNNEH